MPARCDTLCVVFTEGSRLDLVGGCIALEFDTSPSLGSLRWLVCAGWSLRPTRGPCATRRPLATLLGAAASPNRGKLSKVGSLALAADGGLLAARAAVRATAARGLALALACLPGCRGPLNVISGAVVSRQTLSSERMLEDIERMLQDVSAAVGRRATPRLSGKIESDKEFHAASTSPTCPQSGHAHWPPSC